jgi:hypothetical protein
MMWPLKLSILSRPDTNKANVNSAIQPIKS